MTPRPSNTGMFEDARSLVPLIEKQIEERRPGLDKEETYATAAALCWALCVIFFVKLGSLADFRAWVQNSLRVATENFHHLVRDLAGK